MKKIHLLFLSLIFCSFTYAVDTEPINANNPLIEYTGRINFSNPTLPKFSYSGASIRACFQGTSISVILDDAGSQNYYNVILDNCVISKLQTKAGMNTYSIATGLKDTIHEIELFKLTEESFGKTQFFRFLLDKGKSLVEISNKRNHLLEFIGNSITCGYGNEGVVGGTFGASTENHYLTYAAITSRSFNARHLGVCKSGVGIYRNYNGPVTGNTDCMTNNYLRNYFYDASPLYSFAEKPDLVCIDLGTNDFSTYKGDSALFVDNYLRLIDVIQSENYNNANILCLVGPMLSGADLIRIKRYVKFVVSTANESYNGKIHFFEMSQQGGLGYGIDYHPTVAQHLKNAKELVSCIDTLMNWQVYSKLVTGIIKVGNQIDLEFSTQLQDLTGNFSGFTVTADNVDVPISSVSIDLVDKSKVRLNLSKNLYAGKKITVSYAAGSIEGKNVNKNMLERISSFIVVNKLTATSLSQTHYNEFNIYPNPTQNKIINYRLLDSNEGKIVASLYNLQGKLVFHNTLSSSNGTIDFNNNNIQDGSYVLKVCTSNREYIKKIIL